MRTRSECHPDRPVKAYGLCEPCYRRERYKPSKSRQYHRELIEYLEAHPRATWGDLYSVVPGRTRDQLRSRLIVHHRRDLVQRLDLHSGPSKKSEPYGAKLVYLIVTNPGLTWDDLCGIFGKTRNQLKATLYRLGHKYLVQAVGERSGTNECRTSAGR